MTYALRGKSLSCTPFGATIGAMHTILRFVTLLLGVSLLAAARAQSLEIIDLRHRTAQEVIPILQPLLEPGAALSGQDYKLFVRAGSANLAQLRTALAKIDTPLRQLLVTVRNGTQRDFERENAAASAAVRSDGRGRVSVLATQSSTHAQGGALGSVQVVEGGSAFIATGSSVPVVTAVVGSDGRRPWVAAATSYHSLSSGFMVTPRVRGERVVLEIEQHDEQLNGSDIDSQTLATQVSGRLGEWIQLGGISEAAVAERSGILERQYATRSEQRSIWVKVEAR
jgi:hypothetical protein